MLRAAGIAAALFGCVLGGLWTGACGQEGAASDQKADPPAHAPRTESTTSTPPAEESIALFRDRLPPWTAGQLEEIRRIDPAEDGFETEVLHDLAFPQLEALVQALWSAPEVDRAALDRLLSASFAGTTALRPGDLDVIYEDGFLKVARAQSIASEILPRERLVELAGEVRQAGASTFTTEVQVVGVRATDGSFETDVLLQLASGDARVQINARWTVDFERPTGPPRITSIRLVEYEEIAADQPLFSEMTELILPKDEESRSIALHGLADYYGRIDRLAGVNFQGMQGMALGDFNGDLLEDLYVCQQAGLPNQLWIRNADGTVEDRARESRVDFLDSCRTALCLDFDNDGFADLAFTCGPDVIVAYNDGQGVFSQQLTLDGEGEEDIYTLSAADSDGDGRVDIFAGRYVKGGIMHGYPTPYHDARNGASDYFWRSKGRRNFVDATAESGLGADSSRFTLASIWEDFDTDGDLDLYVVNDFGRKNLYRNDGSGHFEDVAGEMGAEDMAAGMGITCADYDLDGDLDFYLTNMFSPEGLRIASQTERFMEGENRDLHPAYVRHARGNTLLKNRGDGTYEDATIESGSWMGRWGWGARFVDFNNDGFEDIYAPNGSTTSKSDSGDLNSFFWRRVIGQSPREGEPTRAYQRAFTTINSLLLHHGRSWSGHESNCVFQNLRHGQFANISAVSGGDFLDDGRAVVSVDWDGDGLLDLLLRNRNGPRLRLLKNQVREAGHFATFDLVGSTRNRDAIGALIVVELEGATLRKRLYAGDGFLSQGSKRLHFGLGEHERMKAVTVKWPDGTSSRFENLPAGAHYRLRQEVSVPERIELPRVAADSLPLSPVFADESPISRLVLALKLKASELSLPSFEDAESQLGTRKVRDFAGKPLLIYLWSVRHRESVEGLTRLDERYAEMSKEGLAVCPLVIDEGRHLAAARSRLLDLDTGWKAGYLDGRSLQALEVLFLSVLGSYEEVPLPAMILCDAQGQIVALYLGSASLEPVLRDAAILQGLDPADPWTTALTGGRWLRDRLRDYAELARQYQALGHIELSRYYLELSQQQ